MKDREHINFLFLELSQFATSRTEREMVLYRALSAIHEDSKDIETAHIRMRVTAQDALKKFNNLIPND